MTTANLLSGGFAQLKRGLRFWDRYWFSPAPLFNLAVCRVIAVGFQLGYLFVRDYYGKLLHYADIPAVEFTPLPTLQLLMAPFPWTEPPTEFLIFAFFSTVIAGILAAVGWKTRLSLLWFAIGNLFIQTYLYSFGRVHHSQALMLLALFIFAIAPSGKSFSVDDLTKRLTKHHKQKRFEPFSLLQTSHISARWPLLLIQWLFAIVYFSAGVHKLAPDGSKTFNLTWLNGYTLQYYLLRDGLWWGSDLGVWLSQFHSMAILSSWVAVIFEVTFGLTLIWPRLVWAYVPLGTMLHTGIYMAQRAPFFQFIALYSVFVPWTVAVKRLGNWLNWSTEERKVSVFYDGLCPLCIRSMTVMCYFDVFNRVHYHNLEVDSALLRAQHPHISMDECRADMHALAPDGSVYKGFFAFRILTKYIPLLWPVWLCCHLPGLNIVGPKVYRYVAAKRRRYSQCSFDSCSIS